MESDQLLCLISVAPRMPILGIKSWISSLVPGGYKYFDLEALATPPTPPDVHDRMDSVDGSLPLEYERFFTSPSLRLPKRILIRRRRLMRP